MPDQTRKLAAIVFTDIVGFTKLSAENEPAALSLLEKQRELLKPIVDNHSGSWLKEIGDGLLLLFDTTKDAVHCAIEIQNIVKEVENLNLRIGIHQGEVQFQGNDVVGDDVNITARIEPFAAEGGIALSDRVNASLARDPDFETKFLGKPKLKGVGQEIKVYCITSHGLPETDMSKVSAKLEPEGFQWNVKNTIGIAASMIGLFMLVNFMFLRIGFADEEEVPSIAILPFENKGPSEDDFYAYGVSSDLITDVTSAGLIRVASLKDIEKLEYQDMETNALAKKLFVRYVAQGTLWKMDSIFQLSMEIFDTKSSEVIYNKRWQTDWKDLVFIKGDLSNNILEKMNVEILGDPEKFTDINPKAYELYLKGRYLFKNRESFNDVEVARDLFRKAIDLDENLLIAHNSLGITYVNYGEQEKAKDILLPTLKKAEESNDKENIATAVNLIGILYWQQNSTDTALTYFERNLAICNQLGNRKGEAAVYNNIGTVYLKKGNIEKGLEYLLKNLALNEEMEDRLAQAGVLNNVGSAYFQIGDYENALNSCLKSIEMKLELEDDAFSFMWSYLTTSFIYAELNDFENAKNNIEKSLEIQENLKFKRLKDASLISLEYYKKVLGEPFNTEIILTLIKDNEDVVQENSYLLYQLFDEQKYLKISYDEIIEKSESLEDELRVKYLNYPNQKKIIEEWEKVQS
jgi:class 3 adenylate cyclase/TolB-like protein/Tfp pilus assembly protein PilF